MAGLPLGGNPFFNKTGTFSGKAGPFNKQGLIGAKPGAFAFSPPGSKPAESPHQMGQPSFPMKSGPVISRPGPQGPVGLAQTEVKRGAEEGKAIQAPINQDVCEKLRVSVEELRIGLDIEKQKRDEAIKKAVQGEEERLEKEFDEVCASSHSSFPLFKNNLDQLWGESTMAGQSLQEIGMQPFPQPRSAPAPSHSSDGALRAMSAEVDQVATDTKTKLEGISQPIIDLMTTDVNSFNGYVNQLWEQFSESHQQVNALLENVKGSIEG